MKEKNTTITAIKYITPMGRTVRCISGMREMKADKGWKPLKWVPSTIKEI